MKRLKKEVSVVAKTCLKYSFKGIARQQRPLLQLPYLVPFFPITPYSAFFDNAKLSKTCLEELVKKEGVSDVYVCGIATDVCVGKADLWKH